MIIRVYFKQSEVLLTVPDDGLVFDGSSFVSVSQAEWVALKWFTPVAANTPQSYPVEYPATVKPLDWENYWVCRVVGVESDIPNVGGTVTDTIDLVDPLNGACLCGVTCVGNEIQNIQVFNKVVI